MADNIVRPLFELELLRKNCEERLCSEHRLTKLSALTHLDAAGRTRSLTLAPALHRYPDLRLLRDALLAQTNAAPVLLEVAGSRLPLFLPEALRACPVWFIRLGDEHKEMVPYFASQFVLHKTLEWSAEPPWNCSPWLTVGAPDRFPDTRSPRLEVPAAELHRTLSAGRDCGAFIAIYECGQRLTIAAYPIDDYLMEELRHSVTYVNDDSEAPSCWPSGGHQLGIRYIEDDGPEPAPENIVRPWVLQHLSDDEMRRRKDEQAAAAPMIGGKPLAREPKVTFQWRRNAAVGLLPTIVNYVPDGVRGDERTWVRLTVSAEAFEMLASTRPQFEVRRIEALDGSDDVIVLVTRVGRFMMVGAFDEQNAALKDVLQSFASLGRCSVAFESVRNGRLRFAEATWPSTLGGVRPAVTVSKRDLYEVNFPQLGVMAEMTAAELNSDVEVQISVVHSARRWQEVDLTQDDETDIAGGVVRLVERDRGF